MHNQLVNGENPRKSHLTHDNSNWQTKISSQKNVNEILQLV